MNVVESLCPTGERKKSYATVWFVLSGSVLCDGRQFSTFCGIANVKKWVSFSVFCGLGL
jgi:ribosomal protein S9